MESSNPSSILLEVHVQLQVCARVRNLSVHSVVRLYVDLDAF